MGTACTLLAYASIMKSLRLLPVLLPLLAACSRTDAPSPGAPAAPRRLKVMTTFYPTTYFASRIAGAHADVVCPLPADQDAAHWQPAPEVLAQYQQADLIVVNGAHFESWTETATLPESRVVVCAEPFKKDWIEIKNALTHSHGPAGAHTHTGVNGHTWPDPINAIAQANAIRDALVARDGAHKDDYLAHAKGLENDLLTLDAGLKAIMVKEPVFASHPTYNYIAMRYGWNLTNFGLEPDGTPSEDQIAEIKKAMETNPGVRWMLWEDEPSPAMQAMMKSLGLKTLVFSPAESRDEKAGDYLAVMRANLARLEAAMKQ